MRASNVFKSTSFLLVLIAVLVGSVMLPASADASQRFVIGELFTEDG